MIQWESQYELGIESIDNQHKELIRLTGRLSDLLVNAMDGEDIFDQMMEIINDLKDYTVYHFRFEEDLFEKLQYTGKEQHILEHNQLIDEIEALDFTAIDEDQVVFGKKILKFLITWVFKHISGSDFLYRDFFVQQGVR